MTIGRRTDDAAERRAQAAGIVDVGTRVRQATKWLAGWFLGRYRTGYYDLLAHGANAENRAHLLLRRARVAVAAGELELGLNMLNQAMAQLPDLHEAVEVRAETLDMLGDTVTARAEFDRHRRVNAGRRHAAPDRHYVLRHPRPRTDMLDYEVVVRRVKRRLFPLVAQGNLMLSLGHPAEALTYYDLALKLRTKSNEVVLMRACALSALGRHAEAITEFGKVLAVESDNADALNSRGIDHVALGHVERANADWNRQFELLSDDRAAGRGCLALRMADYERAIPEFDRAIARDPADLYWRHYHLTALRRLGREIAASDAGLCSSSRDAAWPTPLLALHSGKIEQADLLARADTPQRRAEAAFLLGVIALATDREAAMRWWREVVDMAPVDMIEYAAARNELARLGA